jgi:hypothetical protein
VREGWRLPATGSFPELVAPRHLEEVLIDYDGPQLGIFRSNARRFLGLCVDLDGPVHRWIHAGLSEVELAALYRGAQTVRSALVQPSVDVIDYRESTPIGLWTVAGKDIPDWALPEREALLPADVRAALLPETSSTADHRPAIRIESRRGGGESIFFGDLAAVTGRFQEFVSAMAGRTGEALQLRAAAAGPGSLRLYVETDRPELFKAISERFRRLMIVADDQGEIERALTAETPRVISSFRSLLHAVQRHQVEVLTEWGTEGAYVDPRKVPGVEKSARAIQQQRQQDEAVVEELRIRGSFDGLTKSGKGRFEFYDPTTTAKWVGTIAANLKPRLQSTSITIGIGELFEEYDILIRLTWTTDSMGTRKYKAELLDFQRVPSAPTNGTREE